MGKWCFSKAWSDLERVPAQRVDVGLTVSANGGRDHSAISTSHETELEDDERHGDAVVGVAGVEELPAARNRGPALRIAKTRRSIVDNIAQHQALLWPGSAQTTYAAVEFGKLSHLAGEHGEIRHGRERADEDGRKVVPGARATGMSVYENILMANSWQSPC